MLGQSSIGGASIGSAGNTPAHPPLDYRARASQIAAVVPTTQIVQPRASQFAVIVPAVDIPVPSKGAQLSQIAIVVPGYFHVDVARPAFHRMKGKWLFPLLVQR